MGSKEPTEPTLTTPLITEATKDPFSNTKTINENLEATDPDLKIAEILTDTSPRISLYNPYIFLQIPHVFSNEFSFYKKLF